MDGYALRATDTPGSLRLVGEVAAGARDLPEVGSGTAARIMTGAPLPPGADAVVPVEQATETDGVVEVAGEATVGAHVRAAAHDTRAGDLLELRGALTAPTIAVLASVGLGEVEVRRRPRLRSSRPATSSSRWVSRSGRSQVHDSNGVALAAAVRDAGGEPLILPRARDDADAIERALRDAAARADLLVTSAGVSRRAARPRSIRARGAREPRLLANRRPAGEAARRR